MREKARLQRHTLQRQTKTTQDNKKKKKVIRDKITSYNRKANTDHQFTPAPIPMMTCCGLVGWGFLVFFGWFRGFGGFFFWCGFVFYSLALIFDPSVSLQVVAGE